MFTNTSPGGTPTTVTLQQSPAVTTGIGIANLSLSPKQESKDLQPQPMTMSPPVAPATPTPAPGNQRSFIESWGSFIKGDSDGVDTIQSHTVTMTSSSPISFGHGHGHLPPTQTQPLSPQQNRGVGISDGNGTITTLTKTTPPMKDLERKRKGGSGSEEPYLDYMSDFDDGDEGAPPSLLNLFDLSGSVKKLKLLGSPGNAGQGQPGRVVGIGNVSPREVHITQPSSLPTSPISSPRPVGSPLASPTSIHGGCHQQLQQNGSNTQSVGTGRSTSNSSTAGQGTMGALAMSYQQNGTTGLNGTGGNGNSTLKEDWELTKTGVRERNAAMCNNESMADIYFLVSSNGGDIVKYPAHKYVLAIGSSVFFAMFYGSLAETTLEIVVPDVEPEAFLKMLQYLYSDEINLDEDSVLATLHVAKKYIIPQLAKACVQFLESSLTARNACVLLSQSRIFDEPELMERCWEVIDAQAEMALTSEGFLEIDHSTLKSILSRETLKCKELSIFNAAMAWATAECERREIQDSAGNLRASLGSALQLIRVPTMELKEFADGPAQTGIFSLDESHAMFLHFTASNKPKVGYPTSPRAGLTPQVCHRFQSSAYRSNQWRYRGRCDSIQFCVDRRIFIVGFGLYGSSGGASAYGVHIELKRLGRVLAENDTEFFSDGSSSTFHVYFGQPVQVDPDTYYTASAVLDGVELSYFGQEGMTDVQVGNVTFQFQCSAESTNGTGVQGGQIPELIFYGPSEPNSTNK